MSSQNEKNIWTTVHWIQIRYRTKLQLVHPKPALNKGYRYCFLGHLELAYTVITHDYTTVADRVYIDWGYELLPACLVIQLPRHSCVEKQACCGCYRREELWYWEENKQISLKIKSKLTVIGMTYWAVSGLLMWQWHLGRNTKQSYFKAGFVSLIKTRRTSNEWILFVYGQVCKIFRFYYRFHSVYCILG